MLRNQAQLRTDVHSIALPTGRRVGMPGHEVARTYLAGRLRDLGIPYSGADYVLPFRVRGQDFFNIVGALPGRNRQLSPVLVGAHYDSVIDAPCADDNAAAVAIVLAVAKNLQGRQMERDVVFALFDAEEPPYFLSEKMGSVRFFEDQADARGFNVALIQDLTGHDVMLPVRGKTYTLPWLRHLIFVTGMESHPVLRDILLRTKRPFPLPLIGTINDNVGDMSDHFIFRVNQVPYLFFSCGHWPHYHMPTDTPERLNYAKMDKIATFLTTLTAAVAGFEFGGAKPCDTVQQEIRLLRSALGPMLPILLRLLGLPALKTRSDLDDFAGLLQMGGL